MQETTQEAPKLTNKEVIDKLVPMYIEIHNLGLDAKDILADAKEAGLDAATLAKVAKAQATEKLEDLKDKTRALQDLLDQL